MTDHIGSLILDVQGTALSAVEQEILAHPLVAGVILFARNYQHRLQLQHLCTAIRAARTTPLLILVDQEGGRVQRFIHEFTRLPAMGTFGKLYDTDPTQALHLAQACGWLMASEILHCGIDLSLAPVLDLNQGHNNVIGERAFHIQPQIVSILARAFITGMQEAGMASVGKHFPGHGYVYADSHTDMPIDERDFTTIVQQDLLPFTTLAKQGISAMMAAHIVFPAIDHLPVSYSKIWLTDILRNRLDFHGVIFSDDLNMEGAKINGNHADRFALAREAGCDFVLLCNNPSGAIEVLDHTPVNKHRVGKEKWGCLQGQFSQAPLTPAEERWQMTRDALSHLT